MDVSIKELTEKKLIGKRTTTSLINNKTQQLWQSFMPRKKEIKNGVGTDLYSLQVYEPEHFQQFNPAKEFEKWALLEVSDFDNTPEYLEPFLLPAGLYAVFIHRGSNTDTSTFQYIFGAWLPTSEYTLDERPHFEVLGAKYKNGDPDSEEEIWIPVKRK